MIQCQFHKSLFDDATLAAAFQLLVIAEWYKGRVKDEVFQLKMFNQA
jgi:hypothetical protein